VSWHAFFSGFGFRCDSWASADAIEVVATSEMMTTEIRRFNPGSLHLRVRTLNPRVRRVLELPACSTARSNTVSDRGCPPVTTDDVGHGRATRSARGLCYSPSADTRDGVVDAGGSSERLGGGQLAAIDRVFLKALPAPRGGPVRASPFRRRIWHPAVEAAGLAPLRIHDLRHSAVALWIAAGASPKGIAARAGHTSVATVLDRYGHLYAGHETAIVEALDAMARAAHRDAGNADVRALRR
jgi:hypothetical protein